MELKNQISKTRRKVLIVIGIIFFFLCIGIYIKSSTSKLETIRMESQPQGVEQGQLEQLDKQIELLKNEETTVSLNTRPVNEYVAELTRYATEKNLALSKLSLDTSGVANLKNQTIKIEVAGTLPDIVDFQRYIFDDGNAIIFGSISLRQRNNFLWLERDWDATNILEWLQFEEAGETSVAPGEPPQEKPPLAEMLFRKDNMMCYMELHYLGET